MKEKDLIFIFLLSLLFWCRPSHDPDLGWHLYGGAVIWDQLTSQGFHLVNLIPKGDSINTFSNYWHDYHWLWQLVSYGIFSIGGYLLLHATLPILILCIFYFLLQISKQKQVKTLIPVLLAIAWIFIFQVTSVRPQLAAICALVYSVYLLTNPKSKWCKTKLFILCALLANIHIYWVFIPFLWFCYQILPNDDRNICERDPSPWLGMVLISSAALISPYGILLPQKGILHIFSNYLLALNYIFHPSYIKATISEFEGALSTLGIAAGCLIIVICCYARGITKKEMRSYFGQNISFLVTLFLSLSSIKFIAVFAVIGFPTTVQIAKKYEFSCSKNNTYQLYIITFLLTTYIAINTPLALHNKHESIHAYQPLDACISMTKYIMENKIEPSSNRKDIRIATHFNYGGWCRWAAYLENPSSNIQVTTDGRTQGVAAKQLKDSYDLQQLREGWSTTLEKWKPDFILAARQHALPHLFFLMENRLMENRWASVYRDEQFVVFKPQGEKIKK